MKTAIVFPGQGSQSVGMGKDLYEQHLSVRAVFDQASEALGYDIASICFEGPEEELMKTNHAQVGIFLVSVSLYALLREHGVQPSYLAGHSLGELTACYTSGMLQLDKALMLVIERGRLMAAAGAKFESGMAAVLGMDAEKIDSVLASSPEKAVVVANYNCPGQVVISGEKSQLELISERLKSEGAKRVIPLKVGGAFHSPVMHPAAEGLAQYLAHIPVLDPILPIVLNRTAEITMVGQEIKDQLPLQVKSPVKWEQSIRFLSTKVDRIIECGPGKVLQGLIKKTVETPVVSVYNQDSLEAFLAAESERESDEKVKEESEGESS